VGWANFPPEKVAGVIAGGSIKQLPVLKPNTDDIWRAVPSGTARLTAFISVSARHLRTPMNSPLRSARPEKRPREAGFDEGCSLN
jgi:vacuolar-type H+-ATPase subunit B/Vma2